MTYYIPNLDAEESFADRIGALMERHCPRLMRCGGGHLSRENPTTQRTEYGRRARASTPEQDAEIDRLGRIGQMNATEVARQLGLTSNVVRGRLKSLGIKVPDGRK